MRKCAAVIAFLILAAGNAGAQTGGSGPFVITGVISTPATDFRESFEIQILTDTQVVIGKLTNHIQQPFAFRLSKSGNYLVKVEIPGFKEVGERVQLNRTQATVNVPIILEQQSQLPAVEKKQVLTDEDAVVDVHEVPPSTAVLKDLQRADKKLQKGDIATAQTELESLVLEAPNFFDARQALGSAYQRSHRYRDAEKEFETARGLRPKSATPLVLLSGLYLEELETNGAQGTMLEDSLNNVLSILTHAIYLDPKAAFAYYLLGVTTYKLDRYSQSEENLLIALKLSPDLGDVRLALANLYIRVGDWTRSLMCIDEYLKENPHSANRDAILGTRKRIEQIVSNENPSDARQPASN